MPHSQQIAEQTWAHAEALIEHLEQRSRSAGPPHELLQEIVAKLQGVAVAQAVVLRLAGPEQTATIAQAGVAIGSPGPDPEPPANNDQRIVASRIWEHERRLSLEVYFSGDLGLDRRRPLQELAEALVDIAAVLYLRRENTLLTSRLVDQHEHQQWLTRLYRGAVLQESFAEIASAVAAIPAIDRVSLLARDGRGLRLIASSNQPWIDCRSRQVRLLEQAVSSTSEQDGGDDGLAKYQAESGCQEIHLDRVDDGRAVLVLERFQSADSSTPLEKLLDPHRPIIHDAVTQAMHRDQWSWSAFVSSCRRWTQRISTGRWAAALLLAIAVLWLLPAPLRIPVPGRILAAKSQRLYAPAEGIVEEVLVEDGQTVQAGTPLVRLRSPKLDLQQQTLEGALSTARAKLDSLLVTRRDHSGSGDARTGGSAEEKVLRTEIAGLESQLELIERQQSELLVCSPLSGRVDRWDLQSALSARPVALGQYLMAVVSNSEGWQVELEIADRNLGYVLRGIEQDQDRVTYRVRSDPQRVYEGEIEWIAAGADVASDGRSVVLARVPLAKEQAGQVHNGATVSAEVHCGQRPVGFVMFRSVIQWWRGTTWF